MIKYPINEPNLSKLEEKYVLDVLESTWLSAGGKHTVEFEKIFADYLGMKHAVAVQSGTAALHVALKAFGVGHDDCVILPNASCAASISTVVQCGAKPIVLDVEKETYALDAERLEAAIKIYSPKVVQLVHVYGFPARDTLRIQKLCKQYGVFLLEDSSEALGATFEGIKIGNFGDIATFSIRSEKMIGVGEGGVVVTNHSDLYESIMKLSSRASPFRTSQSPYWAKYFYDGEGYNYRLPHILGAIAHAQIERFDKEILPEKIRVGESFRKVFCESENWSLQKILPGSKPVYWLNSLFFKDLKRDQIRELGCKLYENQIEVRSGFWPLSDMASYNSESFGLQEIGYDLFDRLLILPSSWNLSNDDIQFIYSDVKNSINDIF